MNYYEYNIYYKERYTMNLHRLYKASYELSKEDIKINLIYDMLSIYKASNIIDSDYVIYDTPTVELLMYRDLKTEIYKAIDSNRHDYAIHRLNTLLKDGISPRIKHNLRNSTSVNVDSDLYFYGIMSDQALSLKYEALSSQDLLPIQEPIGRNKKGNIHKPRNKKGRYGK